MTESLVIIPTYNEKDNIAAIIQAILALPESFAILVIDDNSPDGTADIVKELQNTFPGRLFLRQRAAKLGLGTAYLLGFSIALKKGYEYIFEMDADFSHQPQYLPDLLRACKEEGADMAIGSRYVKGGGVHNWSRKRIIISKMGSLYTRMITAMPIKDTTAGFICYKRKVLERIRLDKVRFKGYAFQIEMKFIALKLGFKVKEVPIIFVDRKSGVSKMNKKIVSEAVKGVLRLQTAYCLGRYLKKIRR